MFFSGTEKMLCLRGSEDTGVALVGVFIPPRLPSPVHYPEVIIVLNCSLPDSLSALIGFLLELLSLVIR